MLSKEKSTQPGILLYFISLLLYVLLSELVFNLLGFTFQVADFIGHLYESGVYLGLAFWLNAIWSKRFHDVISWQQNPIRRFALQSLVQGFAINGLICGALLWFRFVQFDAFHHELFVSYKKTFIQFCLYGLVIELNVVADLGKYLLNQWHQNKLQQETFDKEKAQFNLELLRNQINPHFLFNNLNTLSSLIYEDQDKASEFLRRLSRVYRNILEYKNKETVSLKEELDFFENYYELLNIRFQDMLLLDRQIDPNLLDKKLIPLTLQLLVENAIKHNVVSKNQVLNLSIKTEKGCLVVSNPIQKKESLEYSSGLGLKMLSSRYAFFDENKFEILNDGKQFTVIIPLI